MDFQANRSNTFKITTIGSAGVGKTTILRYISTGKLDRNCSSTIGASFSVYRKQINHNGEIKTITLELWDTAGQERYNALIPMYLNNANVILLVYDVNDNDSLYRLIHDWIPMINERKKNIPNNEIVYIIGNKIDLLASEANISIESVMNCGYPLINEGKKLAERSGYHYGLASPYKGYGITEIFDQIIMELANQHPSNRSSSSVLPHTIRLSSPDQPSPKGCCG